MDISQLIDLKDIREHCRKLGHQFNTVESACLVWQSSNTQLAEKHAAWRGIMRHPLTTLDREIMDMLETGLRKDF